MSINEGVSSTGGKKPAVRRRGQTGALVCRKGVWCGLWREYVQMSDGKEKSVQRFKAFPGLSERAARAELQEILVKVNQQNKSTKVNPTRKDTVTLQMIVDKWRVLIAPQQKPRGRAASKSHLKAHILPKLGHYTVTDLSTEIVQKFVREIQPRLSGKTVVNVISTLRIILCHARQQQWVEGLDENSVTFDCLILPECVKEPRPFLTAQEIKRLIKAAKEPFKTILLVLASTGMRINEVLGLRVEDVDFEEKVIRVTKSAYKGALGTPKSKASMAPVPMCAALAKALKNHLKSNHYRENPLGVVFTNRNARPYSDNKLRVYNLHPLTKKLGIKHCGFHAFRHGVASELIDASVPITVVRDQLRHSDVRTTLELYGHVVGNAQRRAVEGLAKKLIA